MSRPVLAPQEFLEKLLSQKSMAQNAYKACYLSPLGGFVTDPRLMLIPLDDHMVHRGDGVFEAIKAVDGRPYLLQEHLDRLEKSADAISMKIPESRKTLEEIIHETLEVSGLQEAILRVFVSRGSGSFGPNPYDCQRSELMVVATELKAPSKEKYLKGARVGKSFVAPKPSPWAQIKSCNYLPNVMMKKEAVDLGLDFTVGFEEDGSLTESSTENMVILDSEGKLVRPYLHRILKGCTMMRSLELALEKKIVPFVEERKIFEADIKSAREVMVIGTTWDVLPVTEYEGHPISSGRPGTVAQKLLAELLADQLR